MSFNDFLGGARKIDKSVRIFAGKWTEEVLGQRRVTREEVEVGRDRKFSGAEERGIQVIPTMTIRKKQKSSSAGVQKRYPCEVCGKKFKYPYNVINHSRVHSGYEPFACKFPHCGARFKWLTSKTNHEKRHGEAESDAIAVNLDIVGSAESKSGTQIVSSASKQKGSSSLSQRSRKESTPVEQLEDVFEDKQTEQKTNSPSAWLYPTGADISLNEVCFHCAVDNSPGSTAVCTCSHGQPF